MHEMHILCSKCGNTYNLKERIFRCKGCGGTLEIVFDYRKFKGFKEKIARRQFNHSRYAELYPVKDIISLGEGGTPLLRSKNMEKELNLPFMLYFKYEAMNPTGSFKDRGSSVEVAKALEFNSKVAACASTGNMGASVSAYGSVAGLKTVIFTPKHTAKIKLEQILAYGSRVYHVDNNYPYAIRMVEEAFKRFGVFMLGDYLYRREGTKSVGFEVAEQVDADYVVSPIGNGSLISAVWKAFNEFEILDIVGKKPRIMGAQARGCDPVFKALKSGRIIPQPNGRTVATAIECGDPVDGERALKSVKDSKGSIFSVGDDDILKARELMARMEGLFSEPGGAVTLAAILKNRKTFRKGSRVVCLVTGHGLKSPFTGVSGKPIELRGDTKISKSLLA